MSKDVIKITPPPFSPPSKRMILKIPDFFSGKIVNRKDDIAEIRNGVTIATRVNFISVFITLNLTQILNFVNPNLKEAIS